MGTCAFKPESLVNMLQEQRHRSGNLDRISDECKSRCCHFPTCQQYYNELVLDAEVLFSDPSATIEAFYFLDASAALDGHGEHLARSAQKLFAEIFPNVS